MKEKNYQIVGWILFVICSLLYMYDSFLVKNTIAFLGGVAFFLGCISFLIPLFMHEE